MKKKNPRTLSFQTWKSKPAKFRHTSPRNAVVPIITYDFQRLPSVRCTPIIFRRLSSVGNNHSLIGNLGCRLHQRIFLIQTIYSLN